MTAATTVMTRMKMIMASNTDASGSTVTRTELRSPRRAGHRQAPRLSCAHPRRSGRVAEGGALLRRYGGECLHRGFESLLLRFAYGAVSEWPKERDWKSRTCCKVRRGFKSRPLRSAPELLGSDPRRGLTPL